MRRDSPKKPSHDIELQRGADRYDLAGGGNYPMTPANRRSCQIIDKTVPPSQNHPGKTHRRWTG